MSTAQTPFEMKHHPLQPGRELLAAPTWLVFCLGALLLISPLSTKAAGVPLFLMWAWGAWLAWRLAPRVPADPLVMQWCGIVLAVFGLRAAATLLWDDAWRGRHFEVRLLVCGLALWCLSTRVTFTEGQKRWTTHAIALACWAALGLTWMHGRDTPTNPIPWAAGVSFLVCVLLARCFVQSRDQGARIFWLTSALAGFAGVLLSQSRGSFGLGIWFLVVIAALGSMFVASRHLLGGRVLGGALLTALVAAAMLSSFFRLSEAPIARLKEARTEIANIALSMQAQSFSPEVLDTSVGARLYMYLQSLKEIQQAPLAGHGEAQMGPWVKALGEKSQSHVIQSLNHLHSDPLSIWFSHGLLGMLSYLLPIAGLAWLAWKARARSLGLCMGFLGLSWMHLSTGLTNFNTIHNYYGVMLSLSVLLLFLLETPDHGEEQP